MATKSIKIRFHTLYIYQLNNNYCWRLYGQAGADIVEIVSINSLSSPENAFEHCKEKYPAIFTAKEWDEQAKRNKIKIEE